MYRMVDAALVRAAVLPHAVDSVAWPDLIGSTDAHVRQWCSWLRRVWAVEEFAVAVELASPVLAGRVRAICTGEEQRVREIRRATSSMMRYLLRATTRATPFGLFAGVAAARFGRTTTLRWGDQHRAVARVDAEWLSAVLAELESDPQLCSRLLVVANSAAVVRDGRMVLSWQRRSDEATGLGEVSVRHSRVVRAIMRAVAAPIRVCEAAEKVAAAVNASVAAVESMLAALVEQGFLITQLRPPMTVTDPLAHVVAALDEVEADTAAGVSGRVAQLRALHQDMVGHNAVGAPTRADQRRAGLSRAITRLAPSQRPVGVDLRLDCDLTLPQGVAREAEAAAAALVRLAPEPLGTPAWRQYHGRFLERYGPRAVVPVAELVADTGLGFPAGYRDCPWDTPESGPATERDAELLALAQRAAWEGRTEIVLDEATISRLESTGTRETAVQPHTELRVQVRARTRDALDRGEFELALAGVSRSAGATTGRFVDLLDGEDQQRAAAACAELPTVCANARPAQISAPALYARTDNVARSRQVLPAVVSLGEHRESGHDVVPLDDLAVTADAERLVLLSLSQQRPVEPVGFNAVEMVGHAHPLVRFVTELSTARARPCVPFSWAAAARLPFLPRVRYRRTILAPARWRLEASDLPGSGASWQDWMQGFQAWRQHFAVPELVSLGDSDQRMRLHLHTPAHVSLLRTELERTGEVTLREAPADEEFGWFDGHAHEVVIPLATTATAASPPRWSAQHLDRGHGHLPGSESWLYLKLYGHPHRQNTVLTNHLPELLSSWNIAPEWWFVRYADPDPHLRLRIRTGQHDESAPALARVNAWLSQLRQQGLVGRAQVDTYYPETGRFGAGTAMRAAESVFAADSSAVLAQLHAVEHHDGARPLALTAASMVQLVCSFHDDPATGMRWLIEHAHTPSGPAPERALREQALRLAEPREDWAAVRALPGGEDLAAAWHRRRTALTAYRSTLTESGHREPASVLTDLLHLHHVRMTGVAPETERTCLRLARAAALSWTARTQGAP
ncbi:thiopeptide-type bacteriocin biosynthesis domain-containing protein [Actinopolyspora saharensis]|uniref:Thiopeptide-type bacteriocin biosynthesis domain-containing protein n=2 Tax=Actinopolyspora saharensis TaxID=995062 RepID=A0A1H0YGL6_9ACTN|nr:thiopeptide-type bacteriocin biosynthesis domain-containing protein [Actinopolyspora saharensis]